MNKKGFTLTELLVTIVIIAVISTLATYGILAVSNKIKANMLETKMELILNAAEIYGEDNKVLLNQRLDVNGELIDNCYSIRVHEIPEDYLTTKEKCDGFPCFKNDVTGEDMNHDVLFMCLKNSRVYAIFDDKRIR